MLFFRNDRRFSKMTNCRHRFSSQMAAVRGSLYLTCQRRSARFYVGLVPPFSRVANSMDRTSATLLDRLRQPGDNEAWARFVHLYTPLLFHWASRAGLRED